MNWEVRTHDLLRLDSSRSLVGIESSPTWVYEILTGDRETFVVVRRARHNAERVAVGVRGQSREERWGSFVANAAVREVLSPHDLRSSRLVDRHSINLTPALQNLVALEQTWQFLDLRWGPAGSVGFELASNRHVTSSKSDLDIIIFSPKPLSRKLAVKLQLSAAAISLDIDILVETTNGAFSLKEFANGSSQLLLRTVDGPRFCCHPWEAQLVLG